MRQGLQRVLGLRAKYSDGARTVILTQGVKNRFRQIPVDPDCTAAFGYVLSEYLIVDLPLEFGWKGTPG